MPRTTLLNPLRDAVDEDKWELARELLKQAKEDLAADQEDLVFLESLIPPEGWVPS
jgi:hypothetical protein